jgi:hypothetical protein
MLLGTLKRYLIGRGPIAPERVDLLRQMPKDSICAEIGVFKGNFSGSILQIVSPQRLHLIDPWAFQNQYSQSWFGGELGHSQKNMDRIHEKVKQRFRSEIRHGQVIVNRGLSTELASEFPDDYFDWIYIDANHTYEAVRADLQAFSSKVKQGGFIAGDNYGFRSDWWWKDGVKRAVDEFVRDGCCNLRSISNDQFILVNQRSRTLESKAS